LLPRPAYDLLAARDPSSNLEPEERERATDAGSLADLDVRARLHVARAAEFVRVARCGRERVVGRAVDFGAHEYEAGLLVVLDDGGENAPLREFGVEFLDSFVDGDVLVWVEAHLKFSPFRVRFLFAFRPQTLAENVPAGRKF